MNIALVACSDNPEILWNCFRSGNLMLEQMDEMTIFLNGPSVNSAHLSSGKYPIHDQAIFFTLSEGVLHARAKQIDLYNLISQSDKVISF